MQEVKKKYFEIIEKGKQILRTREKTWYNSDMIVQEVKYGLSW